MVLGSLSECRKGIKKTKRSKRMELGKGKAKWGGKWERRKRRVPP